MSFIACDPERSGEDKTIQLFRRNAMRFRASTLPFSRR
jgi:hypothetical protein